MPKKVITKKIADKNLNYHQTIGKIIEEMTESVGWSRETLAREITIQIYRNLPYDDRPDLFNPKIKRTPNSDPYINIDEPENFSTDLNDYFNNKHVDEDYQKYKTNVFLFKDANQNMQQRILDYAVSVDSINSYYIGRTPVPMLTLVAFCQIFEISLDLFISKVNSRLYKDNNPNSLKPPFIECPMEKSFYDFCKEILGNKRSLYAYDTVKQDHLMSSLFSNNEKSITLHYVHLLMVPVLKDLKGKDVLYQRGELIFEKKEGVCHVTSKLEVNSQGQYQEYKGFAIICNPNSSTTTCACFLKETNGLFGLFVTFYFRLTPLDQKPSRKIRLAECISIRRSDGKPFGYRLLLTENQIDDNDMIYFAGYLKLDTRENTVSGNELCLVVTEKYIEVATKYFSNVNPSNNFEKIIYNDLEQCFGKSKKEVYSNYLEHLKNQSNTNIENIRIINPDIFTKKDKDTLLLLAWLRKYGISARNDKITDKADNDVNSIHKLLYPEMYSERENPLTDIFY